MSEEKKLTDQELLQFVGEITEKIKKATDDGFQKHVILTTVAGLIWPERYVRLSLE